MVPALHHLFLYQDPPLSHPLIGSSQLWAKHFPYLYPSTPVLCITSTLYAYEDGTDSKFRNVDTISSDAGRLPIRHNTAFNHGESFKSRFPRLHATRIVIRLSVFKKGRSYKANWSKLMKTPITQNVSNINLGQSQWPRGLKCGSTVVHLLGFLLCIHPETWMSLSYNYCVLSGKCICVGLIIRPGESYRVWCVWLWSWYLTDHYGCRTLKIKFPFLISSFLLLSLPISFFLQVRIKFKSFILSLVRATCPFQFICFGLIVMWNTVCKLWRFLTICSQETSTHMMFYVLTDTSMNYERFSL